MSKKEAKNNMTAVVAVTLIGTAAITGTASAITNNEAGLIASSAVAVAGEIVRNKKE
jgi:hypothetical protein